MAATITDAGNGNVIASSAAVFTGSPFNAAVGDWLIAILAASNDGTNGASCFTEFTVQTSGAGTVTNRAGILYDPGAAGAGADLQVATIEVTSTMTGGNVQATFSPNVSQAGLQVYKVSPGAGETISFVAADTTGLTGNTATYDANTVSVTNGDIIFGCAAIETDDAITGDTDTTNGNWSSVLTRLGDGGADASTMSCVSQYKTVNATGNQSWAATSSTARDSARTYLVIRSAVTDLAPGLVTNTQTFHAPTVTPGAVDLSPGLVTNTQTFHAPTVASTYDLTPGLVTNSQTFHAPTVEGEAGGDQALTPELVTNTQTFYAPTVAAIYDLTPSLVTNDQTFYSPTVASTYDLTPGLVTNAQTFHAPTVSPGAVDLAAGLVINTQTFHVPTVSPGAVDLSPLLVTNSQTFLEPVVVAEGGDQALLPGLVTNAQTFHAPTVSGTYDLTPGLVTNSQTFHAPAITSTYELVAGLVSNSQTFHAPTVSPGAVDLLPSLVTNTQTFHAPTIAESSDQALSAGLLQNEQTFFGPTIAIVAAQRSATGSRPGGSAPTATARSGNQAIGTSATRRSTQGTVTR